MTYKTNPVDLDHLDALLYIGSRFSTDEHIVTFSMFFPLDEMGGTREEQIDFAQCGGIPFWSPNKNAAKTIAEVLNAYPALSAELRRLRGLVREYAEAADEPPASPDPGYISKREVRSLRALYDAGKEIAK